jgi:hypothetical protein
MVFPIVGGDGKPTGYEISNSIRFNSASSSYLSFTTSTPTSQRIATWSFWMKKANDATQVIFGSSGDYMEIYNESDGELWFYMSDSNSDFLKSTALHRDQSAWYHIVMVLDTTQGTEANRAKTFVNGTQLTDFISENYPSQNDDLTGLAASKNFHIGARAYGGAASYLDAYIADFNFVDGSALDPTYFGETNDNGVWIPKKPDVSSYGNNGFFLQFKQTGTSANSSGMGADTSGNDNHFASNNLASDHVTTDTPQNNFATFNPLDNDTITGAASFSEGNLVINANGDPQSGCPSTIAVSNGAWYIEGKCLSGTFEIGVFGYGDGFSFNLANHPPYGDNGYPFLYEYGGNIRINNVNSQTSVATFTTNDILAIALDMDNNTIKFFKNGSQVGSTITDSNLSTFAPYSFYVANHTSGNTGNIFSLNTGNPVYTISSGNADANGYGNFEYAPPSGYYALCTKNLAEFG